MTIRVDVIASPEQLTSEARLALHGKLSRRAISIADTSQASQQDGDWHDAHRSTTSEKLQQDDPQDEGVGDFVAEVLRTYHSEFWLLGEELTADYSTIANDDEPRPSFKVVKLFFVVMCCIDPSEQFFYDTSSTDDWNTLTSSMDAFEDTHHVFSAFVAAASKLESKHQERQLGERYLRT